MRNQQFDYLIRSFRSHQQLLESQIAVSQAEQLKEVDSRAQRDYLERENSRRRREHAAVLDWLHADSAKANLEPHATVLNEISDTSLRLMRSATITAWLDTAPTSNNLLWITGVPGSGGFQFYLLAVF